MKAHNIENTEFEHVDSRASGTDVANPLSPGPSVPSVPPVPPENIPPNEKLSQNDKMESPELIRCRAGSLLARLTVEQRTQLFKWLLDFTIPDVLGFIAAPPPRGFGIETHRNTLRRIKGMIHGMTGSAAFETSATAAEYLAETIGENRAHFAPLISELLLQKAFDLASDTRQTHELKDLINSAIKLRELDLKVQRLQLLSGTCSSPPRPHQDQPT